MAHSTGKSWWSRIHWHWWLLLALLLLTEWLKTQPRLVEHWYAGWLYPPIGRAQRWLLGWVPFSVGDVLIALLIALVLWRLLQMVWRLLRRQPVWPQGWQRPARRLLQQLLLAYLLFHALWGLNYYRLGSAHLLQLQPAPYTVAEVDTLLQVLHQRLDTLCADSGTISRGKTSDRTQLSAQAVAAYDAAARQYPFMRWRQASLKPNLLGPWQSYTGYGGYLFPFTGEAQVDFYVPDFVLPMTVCHEMAHQLGFGSESEANLVGFLAARASASAAFRYSAYADAEAYALREMLRRDTVQGKAWLARVPGYLRRDRDTLTAYYQQRQLRAQVLLDWVYDAYLKNTNQPEGLQSYNRVVAWLIAYGKKYGWQTI